MSRADFLGPRTIAVAAGVPPMGTVFETFPAVDCPPRQSLPAAPARSEAFAPVMHKAGAGPTAPCPRSQA